jgi:hypothetical protein
MFVIWGGIHGIYSLYERATEKYRIKLWKSVKLNGTKLQWTVQWTVTMGVVIFSWLLFRANSFDNVFIIFNNLFNIDLLFPSAIYSAVTKTNIGRMRIYVVIFAILVLELTQIMQEKKMCLDITNENRLLLMSFIIWFIVIFGSFGLQEFIYFQF